MSRLKARHGCKNRGVAVNENVRHSGIYRDDELLAYEQSNGYDTFKTMKKKVSYGNLGRGRFEINMAVDGGWYWLLFEDGNGEGFEMGASNPDDICWMMEEVFPDAAQLMDERNKTGFVMAFSTMMMALEALV